LSIRFSSRITCSPTFAESTSLPPMPRSFSWMRSIAASICSTLTGRLRSASAIEARSLAGSNSARRPSFLTTTGIAISACS
jgi:hypothetical protein